MEWETWSAAAACAGNLALALVIFRYREKDPLRIPLLLMCLVMATWTLGVFLRKLTGDLAWGVLDVSSSPWTTPLAFHVILVFVGKTRTLRPALYGAYAWAAGMSAVPIVHYSTRGASFGVEFSIWSGFYLAGIVTILGGGLVLLIAHLVRQQDWEERARTRLFIGALVLGGVFGATELVGNFVPNVPSLGPVGAITSMVLLTVVVLRFGLLRRAPNVTRLVYALSLGAAAVAACLIAVDLFSSQIVLLLVVLALVGLGLVVATREWAQWATLRRERLRNLAAMGRMSAQMAHDLKNPLAALKGTVQYLEVELDTEGGELAGARPSIERLAGQVDRLEEIIEKYDRMGDVSPEPERVDLRALIEATVEPFLRPDSPVEVKLELDDGLRASVDRELVRLTLENLLANAAQAMPDGGRVEVRTRRLGDRIQIEVDDDGPGMQARDVQRAFDDFYTTKTDGSGLGLAFARRVMEAHDGSIELDSALDVGTTVTLRFPEEGQP